MKRKFFLCIGASKSGTTWLYKFLCAQKNVNLGIRKEYNVLSKFSGLSPVIPEIPTTKHTSSLSRKAQERSELIKYISGSLSSYVDYFDGLIEDGRFSMDISPSYMNLRHDEISQVVHSFMERGIETSIILLLRDPIDRLISLAKMAQRNRFLRVFYGIHDANRIEKICGHLLVNKLYSYDYVKVIHNLSRVEMATHIKIQPYELLFSSIGFQDFCVSLDLELLDGFYEKDINVARPFVGEISERDLAGFRSLLDEQYLGCWQYFKSCSSIPPWRF